MGLVVLIAAITIMAKAAAMEGRSSVWWGVITFASCTVSSMLIPLPLINIVVGLAVSYGLMFAIKMVQN